MRRILRRLWQDERGVSLAIIALTMTTLLSVLAFSVDLGLLYTARAEAQRAADAAALAGASAFLQYPRGNPAVVPAAKERAVRYARLNEIRNEPADVVDANVQMLNPGGSVTVTVRREAVPLWFAQLFGMSAAAVTASATAGTAPANSAECVAPIAFDYDAIWEQDYWSSLHGQPVTIGPEGESIPATHEFRTLDFIGSWEQDPSDCTNAGTLSIGQSAPAGTWLNNNWAKKLLDDDPKASWNNATKQVEGGSGWNSPRVITTALYEPGGNPAEIMVKDFLLFFIEGVNTDGSVEGRFLAYAGGSDQGPEQGMTILSVQLTQ